MFDWFKTSPRLKARIDELHDDVRELRADMKGIESEWNTVYESLKRLEAKLSKRTKRDDGDCGCGKHSAAPVAESQQDLLARARQKYGSFTTGRP